MTSPTRFYSLQMPSEDVYKRQNMTFTLNTPMFDFLVLSVIANNDAYGYQISQIIKKAANTKDSTLYPILKRLQDSQYVETYDQQYQGRNRKYYTCLLYTSRCV